MTDTRFAWLLHIVAVRHQAKMALLDLGAAVPVRRSSSLGHLRKSCIFHQKVL